MADQIKYVDSTRLQYLLGKLRDKNADLYLGKYAEAASAAKVKNTLTINGEAFDGSEAKVFSLSETGHTHTAANITDFTAAVQKVITDAGGTSHTHTNLAALETITDARLNAWDAKIGVDDVASLKYSNVGMSGVTDVKGALDILVKNAQINTAALTDTSANMNSLATRLTTVEGKVDTAESDIDALETTVGNASSGLVKKVADLEAANADGGAVANAIKAAQDAADAAAAAVVTEKGRAEGVEAGLQSAIDAINNADTGILAQAKTYADGKDAAIAAAKAAGDNAQADVDALEGVVGEATDTSDKTTVFGKIAKAQETAEKGVADAATAQAAADAAQDDVDALEEKVGTVPDGKTVVQMIADAQSAATYDDSALAARVKANEDAIGKTTDAAAADGSLYARIKQNVADIDAIENDYLKAADKTELEGKITTAQNTADAAKTKIETFMAAAEVGDVAVDTLKEIQDYITSDGTAAAALTSRVAANETAIATLNGDASTAGSVAKAVADAKSEIKTTTDGLDTRLTTAEGEIDALQAAVETLNGADTVEGSVAKAVKDAQDTLQANIDKKVDQTVYNAKVGELEAADDAIEDRLDVIEGDGEGSIAKALADAKDYADGKDTEIKNTIGTATDTLTATTVFGKIKELQEKDAAQDTAIGEKAAADDLDALEALVGTKDDTKDDATVFGAIKAEAARATAAEEALDSRVDALETTVGNASAGLVKDVADLRTDLGTKDDIANADGSAFARIAKNAADIATNAGDITSLDSRMTNAETNITNLIEFKNSIGTITEAEIDSMLDVVYGTQDVPN